MYSVDTVLAATCCSLIHFVFIDGQQYGTLQDDKSDEEGTSEEHHSFVALIDIMFTDGSKRTCTGTIVHDNVVITAAHCFYSAKNKNARAELTASFVIIGTKHLFETGYEQYLPIERVVTHPKFKDWTADLALVYTFAGMTSDKPGMVIPLAGQKTSTPVDSNVTVISWGHFKEVKNNHHEVIKITSDSNGPCSDSASQEKVQSPKDILAKPLGFIYKKLNDFIKFDEVTGGSTSGASLRAKPYMIEEKIPPIARNLKLSKLNQKRPKMTKRPRLLILREELLQRKIPSQFQIDLNEYSQQAQQNTTMKVHNRYLSIAEKEKFIKLQRTEQHHYNGEKIELNTTKAVTTTKENPNLRVNRLQASRNRKTKKVLEPSWSRSSKENEFGIYNIKSYYKNWRRQMGTQQNKLVVETFGFLNMHTCKRYLENAVPDKYQLKGANDVVCYSTEGHYITDKDAGAPAIRQGRLIAVTIGGIECDGDHIAIGMKMNCYCSWINDNLPFGSSSVSCCKNCCDIKHGDGDKTFQRTINKYV